MLATVGVCRANYNALVDKAATSASSKFGENGLKWQTLNLQNKCTKFQKFQREFDKRCHQMKYLCLYTYCSK